MKERASRKTTNRRRASHPALFWFLAHAMPAANSRGHSRGCTTRFRQKRRTTALRVAGSLTAVVGLAHPWQGQGAGALLSTRERLRQPESELPEASSALCRSSPELPNTHRRRRRRSVPRRSPAADLTRCQRPEKRDRLAPRLALHPAASPRGGCAHRGGRG